MEGLKLEYLPYILLIALVSIGFELYASDKMQLSNYDRQESWVSAVIFLAGTVLNGFFRGIVGIVLLYAYQHRLFEIRLSFSVKMASAFVATEFLYYWMHRYSHEVRLGWASHVVHHSPECFNFSIAYRLGVANFFSLLWVFYVPLAWLGFDPKTIGLCVTANLIYQFWLHTEIIKKLGPLEWVLNTPSHHRVHHASNPLYLDRNYGGVLILFDRIFGTFQAEDDCVKIEYGLTEKISSKRVVKIAFMGWVALHRDMRDYPGFFNKAQILLGKPAWRPTRHFEPS